MGGNLLGASVARARKGGQKESGPQVCKEVPEKDCSEEGEGGGGGGGMWMSGSLGKRRV